MLSGKKIFMTGGAGFIGTHLIRKLIDENEIIVYDTLTRNSLKKTSFYEHKNLKLIQGDVLDKVKLEGSMNSIDIVIHLAAIAGIDTVIKNPVKTMEVNLIGTYNVLEAAKKQGVDRFIDFSTSEVYGSHAYKMGEGENTTNGPVGEARWTYSASKLAAEHLSHSYYKEYGLPVISVRPFNIYGPGQVGESAIHKFIVASLKGENLKVVGSGDQIRSWCYVDDLVNAIMLCLTNDKVIGEVFNVGNPEGTITIFGLAEKIISLTNSKSKIEFIPKDYVDVELRVPAVDKAQKLLGYKTQTDLNEGIRKTIEWYQSNSDD